MDLLDNISALLDYITQTSLGGVIPLDIVVHLLCGMLIAIILLRLRVPFALTLAIIFALACGKEVIDSVRMVEFSLLESIKDIAVTMSYPSLLILIRWKKRHNSRTRGYSRGF